jgi:hypothetical protein
MFDHVQNRIDMQSMMLAGVVGTGIRLEKGPSSILAPSTMSDSSIYTLKVDSVSFLHVFVRLVKSGYTFISMHVTDGTSICMEAFNAEHTIIGSGIVNTLAVDNDECTFMITNADKMMIMDYAVSITRKWEQWKPYFQASSTEDTFIGYDGTGKVTWTTKSDMSTISLYTHLSQVERPVSEMINICIVPSVVHLIRIIFQLSDKKNTRLSLSDDLPVRIFSPFDDNGSFIRMFAGTKDVL